LVDALIADFYDKAPFYSCLLGRSFIKTPHHFLTPRHTPFYFHCRRSILTTVSNVVQTFDRAQLNRSCTKYHASFDEHGDGAYIFLSWQPQDPSRTPNKKMEHIFRPEYMISHTLLLSYSQFATFTQISRSRHPSRVVYGPRVKDCQRTYLSMSLFLFR
jgi:hypothetical protein